MRKSNLIINMLIAIAVALSLTACNTPAPIVQYKTVYVIPPDNLLLGADIEAPPDKTNYMSADCQTREKMLYDLNISHMNNLFLVNLRLSQLRGWKVQQETVQSTAEESK